MGQRTASGRRGRRQRLRLLGAACVSLALLISTGVPAASAPGEREARRASDGETDCHAPNQWWPKDWSPDGSEDVGFRAWVCAGSAATAEPIQDQVLAMGSRLWGPMTVPEPDGMGPPIPDTDANGGNGKIDIYVLGATRCVDRGIRCQGIDEAASEVAAAVAASPFGVPGRPEASSGFLLLSQGRLGSRSIVADLAHEFFHILQYAHNAPAFKHWYVEASATWAEWVYTRDTTREDVYAAFRRFQENNESLLAYGNQHQYHSWVWPLFQADHAGMGAPSVFSTWQSFESLSTAQEFDAAIDDSLPFESFYRDFAVTNLQPQAYKPRTSSGLEAQTWQLGADRLDFPRNPHVLTHRAVRLVQGNRPRVTSRFRATVVALAAQNDEFVVEDPKVRQITIDVSSLTNGDNVDLDIVGRLDEPGSHWSRIAATDDELTLCRDDPSEDFDLLYVVISNHSFGRRGNGPSPTQKVAGRYSVTTERKCDVPVAYEGTFSGTSDFSYSENRWSGTARFELTSTSNNCDSPSEPPSRRFLRYCYRFAGGEATWTAAPWDTSICSYVPLGPVTVTLPRLDPPELQIARLDPDPDFVNWFYILVPGERADATMDVSVTCNGVVHQEDITFSQTGGNWIYTPGFHYIGNDWSLHGSPVLDHQSWTFDLQPVFEEA